jgi:hypothetical protein
MIPTPDQVRRAYATVPGRYGAIVLEKNRGIGEYPAEALAFGAVTLGLMSRNEFLWDCATAVGPFIFVPFTPGVVQGKWDLVSQLSTLAHELQHVRDWYADPWGFAFGYAVDTRARAIHEVAGMKPAIMLRHQMAPFREGAGVVALRYAAKLGGTYQCDEADQECARTLLLPFVTSVLVGAETSRAYPQVQDILDAMGAPDAP